jgi:hypothetical protein
MLILNALIVLGSITIYIAKFLADETASAGHGSFQLWKKLLVGLLFYL